jgi:hypothetical protein
MAYGIHWRAGDLFDAHDRPQVTVFGVIVWQLVIWCFWAPAIICIHKTLSFLTEHLLIRLHYWLVMAAIGSIAVAIHFGWFVAMSDLLSPYQGYPDSRFGAFRYFFIFWLLIDIMITVSSLIYIQSVLNLKAITATRHVVQQVNAYMSVKVGSEHQVLAKADINYIIAEDYYARICTNKAEHLVRMSMTKILEQLREKQFVRVHRSTIVNLSFVDRIIDSDGKKQLRLNDGICRDVSKSGLAVLKNHL